MTPLQKELRDRGQWLFRQRSYLPLPLLVALIVWIFLNPPPEQAGAAHHQWEIFCLGIGGLGMALRVWVAGLVPAGTSGRGTDTPDADQLNTTGPYSLVRNPLYLAIFLMWAGVALFLRSAPWFLVMCGYFLICYVPVIIAEEAFLVRRFGSAYYRWAERTPALVPRWSSWKPSVLPFCWRTAARREYSGLLGLIVAFTLLEAAEEAGSSSSLIAEPFWMVLLGSGVFVYLVLRTLKRRTRLLAVAGR
jgi:protein-S-isoprenylcysteine O-methyltransferase Ste14